MDNPRETTDQVDITGLLQAYTSGDREALEKLIPFVYQELKQMARKQLLHERDNHTLNTTGLVHEAYLKLNQFNRIEWKNRAHFYGIAATVMRNILVDYAVKQNAHKRGGDQQQVSLDKADLAVNINLHDILSIHSALERLGAIDQRQMKVVECRFFGSMTLEEISEFLGVSVPTVSRDWGMARAWLNRELNQ